mmetsp:Transcript_10373/g.21347  ORF Transcript_10373/g.21347 Transcript_10373/m.21347 type:complete len:398 (-) Transcript_10373:467-1660(-)
MATVMHLTPVSLYSSATTDLQDSHRSRSCQSSEACPRPRPACLFRGNTSGGPAPMFAHLLKKANPASSRGTSESSPLHGSRASAEAANRDTERGSPATPKTASHLEKSPVFGSSVLYRSNSSSHSQLYSSLEVLRSDAPSQQKVQAANSLANMSLRAELLPRFQEPEFLNLFVQTMCTVDDECSKRFVYMALVRLVGHKEMIGPCLDHDSLLSTTVTAASLKSGSSWRQAARALAILATKSNGSEAFQKLTQKNVVAPIARLLELDQTEFRTDAICAFASWTRSREMLQVLTRNGVWAAVLKACIPPSTTAQAVLMVAVNLLVEACTVGADLLELDAASFARLCEVCQASEQARPVDTVLCAVMSSCCVETLPRYAELGGAKRLMHLVGARCCDLWL